MNPEPFKELRKQLDLHIITREEFSLRWDREKERQRQQDEHYYKGEY